MTDDVLIDAIEEVRSGLVEAELGGNLVKKRIAVGSKGKRGGLRTILVCKATAVHTFCIYVFAKKDTANVSKQDLKELKLLAKTFLNMEEQDIEKALKTGSLQKVVEDEDLK